MRKVIISSLVFSAMLVSGCGSTSGETTPSATTASIEPSPLAPEPTGTENIIDQTAAKAYRLALDKSLAAQTATGLTEFWEDAEGNPLQVIAYDPASKKSVQYDYGSETAEALSFEAFMPTMSLDELDALEANKETDKGSVSTPGSNTFTVLNYIDDATYVTQYELDESGRIGRSTVNIDGETAMTATFTYALTAEAQAAFGKLK